MSDLCLLQMRITVKNGGMPDLLLLHIKMTTKNGGMSDLFLLQIRMSVKNGGGGEPGKKEEEEEEERMHFQRVINSFRVYKQHSLNKINKREHYLNHLPVEHQKLLKKNGYNDMLNDLRSAVETNNEIILHILKDIDNVFENMSHSNNGERDKRSIPRAEDVEKVHSCLKQLVRDWSPQGARNENLRFFFFQL